MFSREESLALQARPLLWLGQVVGWADASILTSLGPVHGTAMGIGTVQQRLPTWPFKQRMVVP